MDIIALDFPKLLHPEKLIDDALKNKDKNGWKQLALFFIFMFIIHLASLLILIKSLYIPILLISIIATTIGEAIFGCALLITLFIAYKLIKDDNTTFAEFIYVCGTYLFPLILIFLLVGVTVIMVSAYFGHKFSFALDLLAIIILAQYLRIHATKLHDEKPSWLKLGFILILFLITFNLILLPELIFTAALLILLSAV